MSPRSADWPTRNMGGICHVERRLTSALPSPAQNPPPRGLGAVGSSARGRRLEVEPLRRVCADERLHLARRALGRLLQLERAWTPWQPDGLPGTELVLEEP